MDKDMDLKHVDDIYEDLDKNKVPRRMAKIVPTFDELEELPDKPEDELESQRNEDNLNTSSF